VSLIVADDDAIRRWVSARHLSEAHLVRWLALAQADRTALVQIAEALRLRTGQLVTTFELLEEIALRERVSIAAILARAEVRRIPDGAGSAPDRARELIEMLRAMRFPRLRQMSDRLAAEIAALKLPGGIKVVLPKDLSSDEVKIEICARGSADLQRLIDALAQERAGLARIADLAGGAGGLEDEI
jgi:hypothetical protein